MRAMKILFKIIKAKQKIKSFINKPYRVGNRIIKNQNGEL